mmetsp:Transcript_2547/g.4473  ORF Transcript_2547/g.4473 Transcript_2547/m.4473 type:complete len:112 (-) Transcript_2547:92-427(-)|eukprot:CAMPEP_0184698260 /NCGR_PEP_ID=MMETSP0313-20130426/4947_1 /TAXON_ID=2792 /ORGANISM="Porphyridium aerugineum, Strain SAG 1380-2" /LENGTH=111 /DNA_ID=CAMNT_0027157177 /DNA_START=182 /DNA_END=517 /DNA_ORIENTATION=-
MGSDEECNCEYGSFIIAAIVAGGGIYGYAKAGSKVSAITGGALGAILATCGFVGGTVANVISILTSGFLAGSFGQYAVRKKNPVYGVIAAATLVHIGTLAYLMVKAKKKEE